MPIDQGVEWVFYPFYLFIRSLGINCHQIITFTPGSGIVLLGKHDILLNKFAVDPFHQ